MALVAIKCVTDLPGSLWVKEDPYLVYNMRVATRCSSPSPANCTFQNPFTGGRVDLSALDTFDFPFPLCFCALIVKLSANAACRP